MGCIAYMYEITSFDNAITQAKNYFTSLIEDIFTGTTSFFFPIYVNNSLAVHDVGVT